MIFKKRTEADIVAEDRKLVEKNGKTVDKLTLLVSDNEELVSKLKKLAEKLKYLKPVKTQKSMKTDSCISTKIDELKIALSHSDGEVSDKINSIISEILLLVVNRND